MKLKDLTNDVVEGLNWLESELGYTREVTQYDSMYFAKRITYKKGCITITVICDNRENDMFFEIFVAKKDRSLCITASERTADFFKTMEHDEMGLIDVEYESVFDYTQDSFNKKQFMTLKNNAELQLRKRGGRKMYVDLHSQLIKSAIASIEDKQQP